MAVVRVTDNFIANLRGIEVYYAEHDGAAWFGAVLDQVFDTLIPNLERFPAMGRPFIEREAYSVEGLKLREQLLTRYPEYEVREYLLKQHVALYALHGPRAFLLAIKDFRQLTYDFQRVWE